MNRDLSNLQNWLIANKLTINSAKTQYLLFHKQIQTSNLPSLNFNNTIIPRVPEASILGVKLDQEFTFKAHISTIRSKLATCLYILSNIRYKLPLSIAKSLYNSIFKSHLIYCISIWGNAGPTNLQPLQILQNRFIKIMLMLPKRTPTIQLYKDASLLNLSSLYKLQVLLPVHKLMKSPEIMPSTLVPLIKSTNRLHSHSTRSNNTLSLFVEATSSTFRHKSFAIQGPILWNNLPNSLRELNFFSTFKRKLFEFLLNLTD